MRVYQPAETVTLVHSGADFFDRLAVLLADARETIHLQTYIFEADETGLQVADALKQAARRGVQVWVLVDGFGSKGLPDAFIRDLQAAGVRFRFFEHLVSLWRWHFGRTLHQKVVVVDGAQAMIGGINIARKYRGSAEEPPWLDFAVYIRGAVCAQLEHLCRSIFLHQYWKIPARRRRRAQSPAVDTAAAVRFRLNDWMRRQTEIYQSYRHAISGARSSIVLVASYFLPGATLRRHLAAAARRGVQIRVLLTGPSDVQLSRLAEKYLSDWLLRCGVRVFRWEKSVMHGKMILVDNRWASLGSYNLNNLSRFRSVELNVDVQDPVFTSRLGAYLDDLLTNQCMEITPVGMPPFSGRLDRWRAYLAYRFAHFLMRVLFPVRR